MREPARRGAARGRQAAALEIRVVELDVTRPETFPVDRDIVGDNGRLDVLVNNAGVLRAGAFEDLDERAVREVMETNFFGALLLSAPCCRRCARSEWLHHHDQLAFGRRRIAGDVAYTASKFAVEGATEALRHEVDRWGIKLALVEPALYATRIFDASMPDETVLPAGYPADSPYRALVEHRLRELRARLPQALDPALIGELLVEISRSDGRQLRWPADAVAKKVLATMFAQDDAARDQFLRGVSGTEWWSAGGAPPTRS